MAFRFRKSIKLAPGIRLNIGKKGGSLSIGGNGATLNIGKKGAKTTVGIPGTGISYSSTTSNQKQKTQPQNTGDNSSPWPIIFFVIIVIFIGYLFK